MIGRLSGTLAREEPAAAPARRAGRRLRGRRADEHVLQPARAPASEVTLFTHLVVREDAHLLFGFGTESERRAFRQLLKISGVGARTALSVLSGLSVAELAQAVTLQDSGPPHQDPRHRQEDRRAPAARAEGQARRRPDDRRSASIAPPPASSDVLNALLALGYSDKEAVAAVKQLPDGLAVGRRHPPGAEAPREGIESGMTIENDELEPRRRGQGRRRAGGGRSSARCGRARSTNTSARKRSATSWRSSSRRRASARKRSTTCCCSARRASARPRSSHIIAHELGVNLRQTSGPVLERAGRPRGAPHQPRAERRAVHRRDPPAVAGRRGDPLSGARGLPDRHHDRRRPGGAHASSSTCRRSRWSARPRAPAC